MTRLRTLKTLLVLVGGLAAAYMLAVPVQSQGPGNSQGLQIGLYKGHEVVAGEVLVKMREYARLAPVSQDLDIDRDEQIGDGSIRRIHSRSHNVETLLARLSESADVEYVEPNYMLYALATPDDVDYPKLWGMLKINAEGAWDHTTGTKDNVVAVVDTGIDYTHPDLAANVWSAPGAFTVTIGDVSITCAAGTHGFNAIRKTCDPMDDNNHGTHVSGTIGAVGDNGVGVVGVNWAASIMGLKFLNNRGSGTTADAVNAIEFAIQAKTTLGAGANVRVLSNSWGGGSFLQTLLDEIVRADSAGMLFVASAGNSGRNIDQSPSYPASYDAPNVVAVAATDSADALASWSNFGVSTVGLAAPGVSIYSTLRSNKYGWMDGTSMAAPHVSGVAALVLSACDALSTVNLKSVLLGYVDKVEGLTGKVLSGGRLNAQKAVEGCPVVPIPPGPPPDFSIAVTPTALSVQRETTGFYTITVTGEPGFTGTVSFTATGAVPGDPYVFDPPSLEYEGTAISTTLKVTPGPTTKTQGWTYNLKITATSGGLVHSQTVKLSVTR